MKCTQCGCTDFMEPKKVISFINTSCEGGSVRSATELSLADKLSDEEIKEIRKRNLWLTHPEQEYTNKGFMKAYVCKKCGHVEFFCDTYLLKEQEEQRRIKEENDRIANNERIQKEIAKNVARINELKALADNDQITVKQQKDYLSEIDDLKAKNNSLEKEIK